MHVSPGYFKDVPGMGGNSMGASTAPPLDVAKLIASWAPRTLKAAEVRALLGEAVKAATALKPRIPADVYSQVAAALKTFADIAGQTAGKAEDTRVLTGDQTKLVMAATMQFWRVAHAAGSASQTTLNLSVTQGILQAASKRMKTVAVMAQQQPAGQEAPAEEKKSGGMPMWGWVAIGVTVLAAVGTVIVVIYTHKKRDEIPEGAEPLTGITEGGEPEEAAA